MLDWRTIARLKPNHRFGMANGGWAYDAYPELETLDAGKAITVAELEGPGVITNFHSTQHGIWAADMSTLLSPAHYARGIIFEVYYNGESTPSVRVPLADFHADGCGGRARHFTSLFVEKAPESYNCFIPMPFERSARVVLRNDTDRDIHNYSFVEWERLPTWENGLGYFHAAWKRFAFPLHADSDEHFFHVDGAGAFLGRSWSVCTDEPFFEGFHFVMEANNEYRLDGETRPRADYLGTEDSFGFSWGFRRLFSGLHNGINDVQHEIPARLSLYRFHAANAIQFAKSLDLRVNWSHEWRSNRAFQERIAARHAAGRGWIDYATTFYWYQQHVGFPHEPLLPLAERARDVLIPNPNVTTT